jgi:hypothetical protein
MVSIGWVEHGDAHRSVSAPLRLVPTCGLPHFELLRHDVTFPLFVEVDEIYNLACPNPLAAG